MQEPTIVNGTKVASGDPIGLAGCSGNLGRALDKKRTVSHIHLKIRDCEVFISSSMHWTKCGTVNPEDYISARFDANGINTNTDCATVSN